MKILAICISIMVGTVAFAQGTAKNQDKAQTDKQGNAEKQPGTLEAQIEHLNQEIAKAAKTYKKLHNQEISIVTLRDGLNTRMGVRFPSFIRETVEFQFADNSVSNVKFYFEKIDQQLFTTQRRTVTASSLDDIKIEYQFGCPTRDSKATDCVQAKSVTLSQLPRESDRQRTRIAYRDYLRRALRAIEGQTFSTTTSASLEVQNVLSWD